MAPTECRKHTFIHAALLFIHPFGPSSLQSFIPSSLHSFIPPFLHSFIPSLFHSFIPSCLHSFIFLFRNPPILIDFIALKVLPFEKIKQKAKIHPQYCFKGELVTPSSGNIAITFYSTIETHGKLWGPRRKPHVLQARGCPVQRQITFSTFLSQ